MSNLTPHLIDNSGLKDQENKYTLIDVNLEKVIKSWKISLFSFEWLTPEGAVRTPDQLPQKELEKYNSVLENYKNGKELERPILGIGMLENIEIGSRRDILLTLYTQGVKTLSVHVQKSLEEEFKDYL
jgi:hypothetical protein